MTWSYNVSLLSQQGKDLVRFLIGDTFSNDPQLQDEEIQLTVNTQSTVYGAAAECCRALAAKFSRSVDQAAGTSKLSFSQMAKAYMQRALEYDQKAMIGATPYMGGISMTDMMNQESNSDRPSTQFTIGMMDNYLPMATTGPETEDSVENPGSNPP